MHANDYTCMRSLDTQRNVSQAFNLCFCLASSCPASAHRRTSYCQIDGSGKCRNKLTVQGSWTPGTFIQ